jgi:hypothetical protein
VIELFPHPFYILPVNLIVSLSFSYCQLNLFLLLTADGEQADETPQKGLLFITIKAVLFLRHREPITVEITVTFYILCLAQINMSEIHTLPFG